MSSLLIALWDVEPLLSTSAVRLSKVTIVERLRQQSGYPRLRMLVQNPAASQPLTERQQAAFREILYRRRFSLAWGAARLDYRLKREECELGRQRALQGFQILRHHRVVVLGRDLDAARKP